MRHYKSNTYVLQYVMLKSVCVKKSDRVKNFLQIIVNNLGRIYTIGWVCPDDVILYPVLSYSIESIWPRVIAYRLLDCTLNTSAGHAVQGARKLAKSGKTAWSSCQT